MECLICKENHFASQCPRKKSNIHNIQEASNVGDVGGSVQSIYATLDGKQADHQSRMIEVAGNISNKTITILIDSRASNSYISPNIVEKCHLKKSKLQTTSLVQPATGAKRKITEFVRVCPLEMNGVKTFAYLNIIPLVSYDVFIGMDWLDARHAILDFHNKTYTCLDEEGN